MSIIKGNNLILSIGGTAVGAAKKCDISISCDVIETASPVSGNAREFVASKSEWSASVSGSLTSLTNMKELVGTTAAITFGTRDGLDQVTGNAIITSAKLTGTRGSLCQYTLSLKGSGELT